MKTIFRILIYGNSEIGRIRLLNWYIFYMKDFKRLGFTKEQIYNSGFVDSLLNYPYTIGHFCLGQLLDFFTDEDVQKLVDSGKINAYRNASGWNQLG